MRYLYSPLWKESYDRIQSINPSLFKRELFPKIMGHDHNTSRLHIQKSKAFLQDVSIHNVYLPTSFIKKRKKRNCYCYVIPQTYEYTQAYSLYELLQYVRKAPYSKLFAERWDEMAFFSMEQGLALHRAPCYFERRGYGVSLLASFGLLLRNYGECLTRSRTFITIAPTFRIMQKSFEQ